MHKLLEPCGIIRVQTWASEAATPPTVDKTLGLSWPSYRDYLVSWLTDAAVDFF